MPRQSKVNFARCLVPAPSARITPMAKTQTRYVCQSCGYESPKWLGRCPDCNEWASLVEEAAPVASKASKQKAFVSSTPTSIKDISAEGATRTSSGIGEFDRVLGGGVVEGSLVLVGGDPGIGKSTILIQAANHLSLSVGKVLYVSGEESAQQIKLRSNRLGIASAELLVQSETDILAIEQTISGLQPKCVFIDSIQTMHDPELSSAAGTVSQVRACTGALVRIAKESGIPVFIVGHVTKEGALAGPRVLEHMVDTVLYFEGDRHQSYRILRAVKNRFGSTDEIGIFEMREEGLVEIANPSEALLSERPAHGIGSVVTATIEGSRPILVEIQALVAPTYFPSPRRTCTGVDYNRMLMILAVLEKRVGLSLGNKDVYINVAGGIKIVEPAADVAMALAVASSLMDRGVDAELIALGEIGLAGEVRSVSQIDKRLKEAARLGFGKALMASRGAKNDNSIKAVGVASLRSAIDMAFGAPK